MTSTSPIHNNISSTYHPTSYSAVYFDVDSCKFFIESESSKKLIEQNSLVGQDIDDFTFEEVLKMREMMEDWEMKKYPERFL